MDLGLKEEVALWIADDPDPVTASALQALLDAGDERKLRSYFNGFLEFGTAGLRGPNGPGPSCMNRAVVGRTAAGIAQYMKKRGFNRVVIGRDARHGSYEYAIESAEIFSGAGCEVFLLPRALPTPVLAYATKALSADIGIMVTASHNPPADNGYKVYVGPTADGISYTNSQIITPTDGLIAEEIRAITELSTQPRGSKWSVVTEEIIEEYIARTATLGSKPGSLKIVYTAMHGVGTQTLTQVFEKAGFPPLILVAEQSEPDPDFPTVAFPNPEEPGAIDLAISTARAHKADLVIANDPDADRCAAAIKERDGQWRMLRGDELGVIFGEWIARTAPTGTFGNSIV
jgi:phosphomannomutase